MADPDTDEQNSTMDFDIIEKIKKLTFKELHPAESQEQTLMHLLIAMVVYHLF